MLTEGILSHPAPSPKDICREGNNQGQIHNPRFPPLLASYFSAFTMESPLRSPQLSTYSAGDIDEKATQRSSYAIRSPSHRNTRFSSMNNPLPSPQQPFMNDPYSEPPPPTRAYRAEIPKSNPVVSSYLSISWMFGFREKWSLLLCASFCDF